jgi:hypothetical protein
MESLVKKLHLPAADEKKISDELDFWKQTGIVVIIVLLLRPDAIQISCTNNF